MGTLRIKITPTNPGNITVTALNIQSTPTPINESFIVNSNNPLDKTWTLDPGKYGVSIGWAGGTQNIGSAAGDIIAINGVPKDFQVSGQAPSVTFEYPITGLIESLEGSVFSLQCLGGYHDPDLLWLVGGTELGWVYLGTNTHDDTGVKWKAQAMIPGSNLFRFECLGKPENPEHVFLNGATADGSVNLDDGSFKAPGVQWYVEQSQGADGYRYSIRCMARPTPGPLYLVGNANGGVILGDNTSPGSFWKFLL